MTEYSSVEVYVRIWNTRAIQRLTGDDVTPWCRTSHRWQRRVRRPTLLKTHTSRSRQSTTTGGRIMRHSCHVLITRGGTFAPPTFVYYTGSYDIYIVYLFSSHRRRWLETSAPSFPVLDGFRERTCGILVRAWLVGTSIEMLYFVI